ncbi:MAG: HPF/RaiA family ribosome-associated protein [Bdellovibrionota bacterium]
MHAGVSPRKARSLRCLSARERTKKRSRFPRKTEMPRPRKGAFMIPLQIVSRDFRLTPSIRTEIKKRVAKLEAFYRRIQKCIVTLSLPHRHQRKGRIFHISIRLMVPGKELVVNREAEEDFSHEKFLLALHDAFKALDRRLEDLVREKRGFVKTLEEHPALQGYVTQVFPDQDYGLLTSEDGLEVYFHRNSLKGVSLDRLEKGQPVQFQVEEGVKGPQATFVRKAGKARRASAKAA